MIHVISGTAISAHETRFWIVDSFIDQVAANNYLNEIHMALRAGSDAELDRLDPKRPRGFDTLSYRVHPSGLIGEVQTSPAMNIVEIQVLEYQMFALTYSGSGQLQWVPCTREEAERFKAQGGKARMIYAVPI